MAKKKRKIGKLLPQISPKGIERTYTRELLRMVRKFTDAIEKSIFEDLPGILNEAVMFRPDSAERQDNAAEMITNAIAKTELHLSEAVKVAEMKILADRIASVVIGHNQRQINKVFRSAIGIDIIGGESLLQPEIQAFVGENVGLITSIEGDLLRDVEQVVFRGARQGLRHEEVAKNIRGRFKVSRNRAKLIARDQVNKFNGKLGELRQKSVGVTHYIWRTVRDERVRSVHASREGYKFSWKKPPPDGHPGEPIQCRCFAEPILDKLI